jgi:hypothetical protein
MAMHTGLIAKITEIDLQGFQACAMQHGKISRLQQGQGVMHSGVLRACAIIELSRAADNENVSIFIPSHGGHKYVL